MAAATKAVSKSGKSSSSAGKSHALTVKRQLRKTTPRFIRHAPHRKASLGLKWKKPRGLHNKQKDNKKGSSPKPGDGYRTPPSVRGLHISGKSIIRVERVVELAAVNPENDAVVIGAVGAKRQRELLSACVEKKITVLNHKPEARIAAIDSRLKSEKEKRDAAKVVAKEKAAKAEKSESKKKDKAEPVDVEAKKHEQDKIKEEVLTSKQQ